MNQICYRRPVGANANPLRLVERHFIRKLPATQNKARAQRKCRKRRGKEEIHAFGVQNVG